MRKGARACTPAAAPWLVAGSSQYLRCVARPLLMRITYSQHARYLGKTCSHRCHYAVAAWHGLVREQDVLVVILCAPRLTMRTFALVAAASNRGAQPSRMPWRPSCTSATSRLNGRSMSQPGTAGSGVAQTVRPDETGPAQVLAKSVALPWYVDGRKRCWTSLPVRFSTHCCTLT